MFADVAAGYGFVRRANNRVQSANSRIRKSTEKLASMMRINRAGDDAAGLAISEKMKAECTLLHTAQKNVKDGISLVQTAEGALQEIQDMLKRLVELSDQSANGTYVSSDRDKLQREVDQLKREIDRIAKTTNFNGINLIDGSLNGVIPNEQSQILNEVLAQSITDGTMAAAVLEREIDAYSCDELGIISRSARAQSNATDVLVRDEANCVDGQAEKKVFAEATCKIDFSTLKDGDYLEVNGTRFNFKVNTTSGGTTVNISADSAETIAALESLINQNNDVKTSVGMDGSSENICTISADGTDGTIEFKQSYTGDVDADVEKDMDGKKFKVVLGGKKVEQPDVNAKVEGKGTENRPIIRLEGNNPLVDGCKLELGRKNADPLVLDICVVDTQSEVPKFLNWEENTLYLSKDKMLETDINAPGSFHYAIYNLLDSKGQKCTVTGKKVKENGIDGINFSIIGSTLSGTVSRIPPQQQSTKFDQSTPGTPGSTPTHDTSTIVGNESIVEAGKKAKAVYNVNLSKLQAGDKITFDGKTIEFIEDGGAAEAGNIGITLSEDMTTLGNSLVTEWKKLGGNSSDCTCSASLVDGVVTLTAVANSVKDKQKIEVDGTFMRDPPPVDPDPPDDPDIPSKTGKALRLQIGEGTVGAVYVSLEDLTTKGLKIDGVNIGTQEGAADAIDTLRSAINKVSSNRGTLGALTNRLEHAYNNLGISYENITDAETKISGADVAQEMMRHTKNQIVLQTAQSMLAQSMNLERQSVQQLLSF